MDIDQWSIKTNKDGCSNFQQKLAAFSQLINMNSSGTQIFWGSFFMIFGSVFFSGFFYAAIFSKMLPSSGNVFISAVQNDRYYCFLLPLTIPVIIVAVYCHWLSMKLFEHA